MSIFKALLRGLEPLLTGVLACGIIVATMWFIEPKYLTHPSHFIPDVPDELILLEVKEMPGCHERTKRWIMSAGELTEQELDPRVTIMICGR